MAGLLSRFTTFIPNAVILSNDHNQEFNRIVQLLNGTTTNLKTSLKTSDAGDPPLELDQLSTGPILKGFQGGIEKFRFRNDGSLRIPGIYDSNDNEELLFVATASAVNEFTMTNAATGNRPKLSLTGNDANIGLDISPKGSGQLFITGSSPVRLPSVTPSNNDDAARKQYVDDRIVPFSINYFIDDPSTFPLNSDDSGLVLTRVPQITGGFVSKIVIIRTAGSHTPGGSVTFKARIFNNSSLGSGVQFNDTNNAANTVYSEDFADVAISEGNYLLVHITARSGTVSERHVHICLEGYRKVQ